MHLRSSLLAAVVAVAFAFLMVSAAHAQSADLWTVQNVPVDATGASPSAAKESALVQGRRKAWQELFRRLTPSASWASQPQTADTDLESMVKSFDLYNEKHSSTRYLATVTYVFNPASVRNALRLSGVQYSESIAKPVLVVALEGGAWQPDSAWGLAWAAQSRRARLVPVAVPVGDAADNASLATVSATADWSLVRTLADRYGAGSVLVASATRTATGVAISTTQIRPEGRQQRNGAYARNGTEDEAALAQRAASIVADGLQEEWKRSTAVDFASQSTVAASVSFRTLQEWVAVRRSLEGTRLVQRIAVDEMNMSGARLRLDYVGKVDQLQTALAQANVSLSQDDRGNWILSRNASATAASSPNPVVP